MIDFLKIFQNKEISLFLDSVNQNKKLLTFNAPTNSKAVFLGLLNKRIIFVAKDIVSGSKLAEQLKPFSLNPKFLLTTFENNFGLVDVSSSLDFYSALFSFCIEESKCLIVTVDALFQKLPNIKEFLNNIYYLKKNQNYTFKNLLNWLFDAGYVRVESVSMRGQFSLKGDIWEIFPINSDNIVRLEFFDDELEKITYISNEDRKFIEDKDFLEILGINFDKRDVNLLTFFKEFNDIVLKNLYHKGNKDFEKIANGFENLCQSKNEIIVCFDEPVQLESLKDYFVKSNNLDENNQIFINKNHVFDCEMDKQIAFASVRGKSFFKQEEFVSFNPIATKKYVFNFQDLLKDIKYNIELGNNIVLFCGNEENFNILKNFLNENLIFPIDEKFEFISSKENLGIEENETIKFANNNINIKPNAKIQMSNKICVNSEENNLTKQKDNGRVYIFSDFLPYSFACVEIKCLVIGTYDLFKKREYKKSVNKNSAFYAPQVGDFVVHETHGIGKCIAVEKLKFTGVEKDYFVIEYADGDKFYLPSENADTISAYYGGETLPKLNKLGGADFAKLKERVYKNVKQLAFDLLELYAKREKSKGFVYKQDDYLMEAFENAFPYEETQDQLLTIADIKKDMESGKIMDRLICGDVGYGKTEVALRAVYKAVLSGKQVAFLCPTTILSEQHFKTCLKRFAGFMVKVARLNRLVPNLEQKAVLKGLADGSVNVVCGTHKLLSKEVEFKNLGLLVLDEEQRFGVEDKEKIKNIKNNVDVLTLSATPIPRTLHMSLSGIRDISIINTPPKERIPVQTYVVDYSDDLLVRAVNNELSRGGQVLIVFNRVEFIYKFSEHVQKLFPNIKIGVAHGKLNQKQLEKTIISLYNGDYNILIATTLIENGIDLPSANTLIVVDADKLGLSALYQLRGRIGRSDKMAYAYFTYDSDKQLTESAFKRLEAIMEFTQLGSGFKIAMRDLEIRGAGNVLGKQQHGAMEKVGYDLYCKLLNDAVKEIKGEKTRKRIDIKVDISLNAYISEEYIKNETMRIDYYSKISGLNSFEEVKNFIYETEKVYGKLPCEMYNLIIIAFLKNLSSNYGVSKIIVSQNLTSFYFENMIDKEIDDFLSIFQNNKIKTILKDSKNVVIFLDIVDVKQRVEKLCEIMSGCKF